MTQAPQISGSLARRVPSLPAGKGHLVTQVLLGSVPEGPCGAQAGEHLHQAALKGLEVAAGLQVWQSEVPLTPGRSSTGGTGTASSTRGKALASTQPYGPQAMLGLLCWAVHNAWPGGLAWDFFLLGEGGEEH